MKRRVFLCSGLAAMAAAGPSFAQSFTDSVVAQLRQQGFTRIRIERTMLGRTRIQADGSTGRREIILNPKTGEILRDLWISSSGGSGGAIIDDDDSGKGRGRGRGGDDGDDNDDDDDDDSDNSGSGNSGGDDSGGDDNSGSGGGDDD